MKLTKENCRAVNNQVNFHVEIDVPAITEGMVTYGAYRQYIPMSGYDDAKRLVRILTEEGKSHD